MACDDQSLRAWYESYMAEDGEVLKLNSPLVQAVESDNLGTHAIEQRICDLVSTVHVAKGFCTPCQCLFDNWPLSSYPKDSDDGFQPPWKHARAKSYHTVEIEAATRSGCKFCAFLLQMLKGLRCLRIFRQIESRLDRLGEQSTASLSVGTYWYGYDNVWLDLPNKLSIRQSYPVSFICDSLDTLVNYSHEDLGIFDKANKWLRTCSESHECCNVTTIAHLPTRLVSITGGQPRLVVTATLGTQIQPLRYATLSYCWGQRPFLKLKSSNLDDFVKEIPIKDLPQTFTDAFEIIASLAIDYIWIDSLCIVQDDNDDWQKEADLMQAVYSGSYVNIAATSSKDAYGGCLGLRTPYFNDGVCVNVTTNNIQEGKAFYKEDSYFQSVCDSHLMTRGWVIQEKVLAPRTLSFGDRGTFWECRGNLASEHVLNGIKGFTPSLVFDTEFSQEDFWREVVRIYSAASLTVSSDKLPALSGMARAVFNVTADEYLAGLWRRNIELHLCWHIHGLRSKGKRPACGDSGWIAPSWSWASITGEVLYQTDYRTDYEDEPQADDRYSHVYKTEMTFSGAKPFGQLSRGVLYMRCAGIVEGWFRDPAVLQPPRDESAEYVSINSSDGEKVFPVRIDCLDDGWRNSQEIVYLVPLAQVIPSERYDDQGESIPNRNWFGLVLRKTGGVAGEFCRIGAFDLHDCWGCWLDSSVEPHLGDFLQVLNESSEGTARRVCAEVVDNPEFPDEKYAISLV